VSKSAKAVIKGRVLINARARLPHLAGVTAAMRAWILFLSSLLALSCYGVQAKAEDVTLKQLSGARIDSNWFRYLNSRFGLAIDIPTKGYRYTIPVNGSGLTLTSFDGDVVITIYAHFVVNLLETANNDVRTPYLSCSTGV